MLILIGVGNKESVDINFWTLLLGTTKDENFCFFHRNFGRRQNERGGRNVDDRNIQKFRQKSEKFWQFFQKIASNWKISEKDRFVSVYFGDFSLIL